jgi:hypothetical protein
MFWLKLPLVIGKKLTVKLQLAVGSNNAPQLSAIIEYGKLKYDNCKLEALVWPLFVTVKVL